MSASDTPSFRTPLHTHFARSVCALAALAHSTASVSASSFLASSPSSSSSFSSPSASSSSLLDLPYAGLPASPLRLPAPASHAHAAAEAAEEGQEGGRPDSAGVADQAVEAVAVANAMTSLLSSAPEGTQDYDSF